MFVPVGITARAVDTVWHARVASRPDRLRGRLQPRAVARTTWHEDMALMREAGSRSSPWSVFSWSWLEPAKGEYDFGWLDEVMGLLHENGIAVDLATATATPALALHRLPRGPPRGPGRPHPLWPGSRRTMVPRAPRSCRSTRFRPDDAAGPALPRPPCTRPVARLGQVRLPQPAVLLRHLRPQRSAAG